MAYEKLLYSVEEDVSTITLDRPEKLNALDTAMLEELSEILDHIDNDPTIRGVLLRASGEKAFCVGGDIKAWAALTPIDMWRRWIRDGHRVFDQLAYLRQPVVAAINGLAIGGGLELALAADIRIASEDAQFAQAEVSVGTLPGWGGTSRLKALIGPSRAKQMIFTCERIDARTAESWGLVNRVVSQSELVKTALATLKAICQNAPISVQLAKELINSDTDQHAARVLEGIASGLAAHTHDGQEGPASFRERRNPQFTGK